MRLIEGGLPGPFSAAQGIAEIPGRVIASLAAAVTARITLFGFPVATGSMTVQGYGAGEKHVTKSVAIVTGAAVARKIGLEDAKQQFLRQAGINRFGEPEEIAGLMAFAVSPAARWLTGTVLRMDGGEVKSV